MIICIHYAGPEHGAGHMIICIHDAGPEHGAGHIIIYIYIMQGLSMVLDI